MGFDDFHETPIVSLLPYRSYLDYSGIWFTYKAYRPKQSDIYCLEKQYNKDMGGQIFLRDDIVSWMKKEAGITSYSLGRELYGENLFWLPNGIYILQEGILKHVHDVFPEKNITFEDIQRDYQIVISFNSPTELAIFKLFAL